MEGGVLFTRNRSRSRMREGGEGGGGMDRPTTVQADRRTHGRRLLEAGGVRSENPRRASASADPIAPRALRRDGKKAGGVGVYSLACMDGVVKP